MNIEDIGPDFPHGLERNLVDAVLLLQRGYTTVDEAVWIADTMTRAVAWCETQGTDAANAISFLAFNVVETKLYDDWK